MGPRRAAIVEASEIETALARCAPPDPRQFGDIVAKARSLAGLDLSEAATLLAIEDPDHLGQLSAAALDVKRAVFDRRVILFASLHLPDPIQEAALRASAAALLQIGHRRLRLLAQTDGARFAVDDLLGAIGVLHRVSVGPNRLRRLHVEVPPLSVEDFSRLREAEISVCEVFQGTYHPRSPARATAPSHEWRLQALDRAHEAGLGDVATGILFGLHDHRFEVLALLSHAEHLRRRWGTGLHTATLARSDARTLARPLSDRDFLRVIAVIRLALPWAGIALAPPPDLWRAGGSLDESPAARRAALGAGVTQLCASDDPRATSAAPLDPLILELLELGHIPSFCTACYRVAGAGPSYTDLAEPSVIQDHCLPNALLTLAEYVEDFTAETTRRRLRQAIEDHVGEIASSAVLAKTLERLAQIHAGKRDLFF
jgi:2-iminoacetate synthase